MSGRHAAALERFPTLRQSRLSTFDRCALSSSFEEEFLSGWSTHAQARGQIFHRVAAKAIAQMYDLGERTIPTDAAIAILEECLRQEDVDKTCPKPRCGRPIIRREGGRIYCEKGHDHRSDFVNLPMSEVSQLRWVVVKWAASLEFDIKNLVDVEQRLLAVIRYPDPDKPGEWIERTLTGALDVLFIAGEANDEFVVIDWKDTWGLPGPNEVGFDGYFQQRFYAWLVFVNYPMAQRVTLREWYVRFGEVREATVFRSDMVDVAHELSALAERFDRAHSEKNFPPTPGQHCSLCARPASCPIFPEVRQEGLITDDDTAARIAKEITVAQEVLKNRRAALSAYTSVHGPQEVSAHKGRRVWGHKRSTRTARPSRDEMAHALAAQRAGVPITLDALYKETVGTRFVLHTPDPHEVVDPTADDARLMAALEASVAKGTVAASTTEEEAADD